MKKKLEHRQLVKHIIEITGTASPKEIHTILSEQHGIKVDYQTVYQDVSYLRESSNRWLSDTLKTSWNIKLVEVYTKLNEDINQLRELKNELVASDMPVEKKLGKVAFADRIITEQYQFLSDFMGGKAIYTKLKEYIENVDIEKTKQEIKEYTGIENTKRN